MRLSHRLRVLIPAVIAVVSVPRLAFCIPYSYDDVKNMIGWTALRTQMGDYMPTGDGVSVQHVEASSSSTVYTYMPNTTQFPGHTFIDRTNLNNGSSVHATTVAMHWYGPSPGGISPGVGTSTDSAINCYYAGDWLNRFSHPDYGSSLVGEVINNSWIGGALGLTLNRIDKYVVDRGVLMFSAVNNVTKSDNATNLEEPWATPWATYNGIAVGRYDGNSKSGRPSAIYGTASKPDLVAPSTDEATSYATPVVSGVGCLLLESARDRGFVDATKPDTMKALMLAGATKRDTWTHTTDAPLDPVYGAGTVNVLNSYNILASGKQAADEASLISNIGWDRGQISYTDPQYYFFNLDRMTNNLSAVLTWNDPGSQSSWDRTLDNNLNLALYTADNVGGSYQISTLVQQSTSELDNVELIWGLSLAPGTYALKVWAADNTVNLDYGLAWMANPGTIFLAGDANRDGTVSFEDFSILQNCYGMASGSWLHGDFTGDGLVSFADFAVLQNHYGQVASYAAIDFLGTAFDGDLVWGDAAASVPEPATCLFLAIGLAGMGLTRGSRGR